jgi:hypothetical protein
MTAAREYDSVRTTTDIVSDDGRTIPAGVQRAIIDAKPDGTCLAEFAFAPQTVGPARNRVCHDLLQRDRQSGQ